jgi:hypothetical protein
MTANKKSAVKAKPSDQDGAEVELVEIEFNGAVFTVPKDRDDWSVESELAMFEARATGLSYWWTKWAELGLGQAQWDTLINQTLTKRGDLVDFVKLFVKTVVAECGE